MKMTHEMKRELTLIGHGLPAKIRETTVNPYSHPMSKKIVELTNKSGKRSLFTVSVPCECERCITARKRVYLAKVHTGNGLAYNYAILKDGSKLTIECAPDYHAPRWNEKDKLMQPCDCYNCTGQVKFFRNNSLPEHVHVRRRLHQMLSRYLP